ncbi:MAG: ATP phosphoribosyltransferase regulatory subunit [Clostridiales bacterium]|nr:ATP phosphoribosyltransferase regulatory subunit [Clostridiales bacterium]
MINLLHIPEGVRDIYGKECFAKSKIENSILGCIHRYGYSDVETPSFEYFDIFNKERGTVPSKDMYKFFDKEGNTLVLRPDITPAIARTAAKYYKDCTLPIRLCYRAKQFINYTGLQGKLKQTTQVGVELYNDNSVYGDFEMLSLTIDSILASGIREFQLEIGIADFYNGIVDEAGLTLDEVNELREILEQKNIFALDNFVSSRSLDKELANIIKRMAELYGSKEIIDEILVAKLPEKSRKAVERLNELYNMLEAYGYGDYVSFDLSMLSKYSYYTGIFFKAITYGSGEPIAYGGRYDNLVAQFGFETSAIGMSITIDYILQSMDRQKLDFDTPKDTALIIFNEAKHTEAINLSNKLRKEGRRVKLCFDKDGSLTNRVKEFEKGDLESVNRFVEELEFYDVSDIVYCC